MKHDLFGLATPTVQGGADESSNHHYPAYGLLMLRNYFLDFAVEHWLGCRATEPGFAGDIGAIEVWLMTYSVSVPFLDHIISALDEQSSGLVMKCFQVIGLIPLDICQRNIDSTELADLDLGDLPSRANWAKSNDMEMQVCIFVTWGSAWHLCQDHQGVQSSSPNIFILLEIAYTIPVKSCQCYSSATIGRLNNFMRGAMAKSGWQHRHSSRLAVMLWSMWKRQSIYLWRDPRRMWLQSVLVYI